MNPSLTAMANALRVGDHLTERLSRVNDRWPDATKSPAVYVAGVMQGFALVTFPAASTIFTSPEHYGLSSLKYGRHLYRRP